MYGTIMRAKVKAGHREALEALSKEWSEPGNAAAGFHSAQVGWEDKDPDRVVIVVHFTDKDSYVANAESPEQDADYRRMLEHLEAEPDWIDVHWADYVGKPLPG